jgi:hypothetical protein
MSLSPGSQK